MSKLYHDVQSNKILTGNNYIELVDVQFFEGRWKMIDISDNVKIDEIVV